MNIFPDKYKIQHLTKNDRGKGNTNFWGVKKNIGISYRNRGNEIKGGGKNI